MLRVCHFLKNQQQLLRQMHPKTSVYRPRTFSISSDEGAVADEVPRGQSGKVFAPYAIYKGKTAMRINLIQPQFTKLNSGYLRRTKEGIILLEFAPAKGVRQYDWDRKQLFALSVSEVGQLLAMGPQDSCEFFHDPNMQKSDAGKVIKVLKVASIPGKASYSFVLNVSDKKLNVEEKLYIPVEKGELAVMKSSFNSILPYLIGWNFVMNSAHTTDPISSVSKRVNFQSGMHSLAKG